MAFVRVVVQAIPTFGVAWALCACGTSREPAQTESDAQSRERAKGETGETDAAAGGRDPNLPPCSLDDWDVAPGFTTSEPVDYVAARWNACKAPEGCPTKIVSEFGEPCATATDREACEHALTWPGQLFYLVTTQGDTVRKWHRQRMAEILAPVDTLAEAIWMARSMGFGVACDDTLTKEPNSVLIEGVHMQLDKYSTDLTLRVHEDGTVETVSSDPPLEDAPVACPAIGCTDNVALASDLDVSLEGLRATTFEACLNDECIQSGLSTLRALPSPWNDEWLEVPPLAGHPVLVTLGTQDEVHPWLQVSLGPRLQQLVEGDVYSARVTAADGRELMHLRQAVGKRPPPPPAGACGPWPCITLVNDTRSDPDLRSL